MSRLAAPLALRRQRTAIFVRRQSVFFCAVLTLNCVVSITYTNKDFLLQFFSAASDGATAERQI